MTTISPGGKDVFHDGDDALSLEAETLRALYGEDNVTLSRRQSGIGGQLNDMISINLSSHVGKELVSGDIVILSTHLPPSYPENPPHVPTLTASALTAADASQIVSTMLDRCATTRGEVCLFDYCEGVLNELRDELALRASAPEHTPNISESEEHDSAWRNLTTSLVHGSPITDRKSVFQAHIAPIQQASDAPAIASAVRTGRKGSAATHIMWAYRLRMPDGHITQEGDDDGEKGGAKVILHVLQQTNSFNIAVAVSRWYGGINLGPVRFRHIASVTRDAIDSIQNSSSTCLTKSRKTRPNDAMKK